VAFSSTLARQMRSRLLAVLLVMCGLVLVNSLFHGMMDQARIQAAAGTENTALEASALNSPMARNLASMLILNEYVCRSISVWCVAIPCLHLLCLADVYESR
jgi:hypothetical protein